jgi:hypothetical protein
MNADGELEGAEKDVAEMKIEAFLSNQSVFEIPKYDEIELETEIDLDKKVREIIREMSSDEKEAMREKVRAGHPEWMEQSWHALAILDSMVAGEEIDDEILLAHAVANLRSLDGEHDEDYHQDSTQQEKTDREEQLRILVQEKYEAMSPEQRAEAIKNARLNHLSWTPVRSEYLAMLDAMYESGDIPKELKPIAKSTINLELDFSYDDAFEDFSDPDRDAEIEKRDKQRVELRKLVNAEVLKLEPEEVEQLVAATQEKYPNWKPVAGLEVVDELNDNFDDFISRFESDGTFWDSLKTRFRTLDFVWIGLGMISAFAIAFTLGQSGKKETTK